jgi:hypothetical protein
MTLLEELQRFETEFIKPLQEKRDSVSIDKRVNNPTYKQLALRTEFLELLLPKLIKAARDCELYAAVSEDIVNKMDKYRLVGTDRLLDPQIEQIEKIYNYHKLVKDQDNYEDRIETLGS